ncbi:MAG: gliding motility-associated C-terminal domain-containing protein [Bacteroidetes bacterium]|nr:gliding motility-associated C-terminal domain-containing protein [Bacteroidota bacterium]
MKKILTLVTALLLFFSAKAQLLPPNQPEQDACNALVLCGNTFTSSFSYQGQGLVNDLTNCMCDSLGISAAELNSVWLRLNVNTGGTIVFTLTPISPQDDYDFAVINITGKSCSNFSPSDVVRCNFNNNNPGSNVNGVIGLSNTGTTIKAGAGAFGNSFQQAINATSGDVYLIMINNFGNYQTGGTSQGFTIDFTGSTATFNGTNPLMSSITTSCNSAQQIMLVMNQNILCNTIEPGGTDFGVVGGIISGASGVNCSGSNGYTDKIIINFSAPLPAGSYNLNAQVGTDGNSLLNTCNLPLIVPASLPFVVAPYTAPEYVAVIPPSCSEIKIALNKKVRCDSIARNGSDFSLSGPQNVNIISAYGTACDTTNFTDTVVLVLQTPLSYDGTYTITAKKGTDGNTLLDSCGLKQAVGNHISFSIQSYDGQLIAPSDTVLCRGQYIQLVANNNASLPLQAVNCGTDFSSCSGNNKIAFVGGKDSLSDANTPFFGSASDQRVQYLFTGNELKEMGLKPGLISQLQWKILQKNSTQPFANLSIKMGCSGLSGLGSNFIPALTTVFTSNTFNTIIGWNSFILNTPYNWNGISNLIIEVCYDNISGSGNDFVAHSITPFISVLRSTSTSVSGCAISSGAVTFFRNLRPKIRFNICEPPTKAAVFSWSPSLMLSDSSTQSPTAFVNQNTTYHVSVRDKDGCLHRDSVIVTLSERHPTLEPKDSTICWGKKITLTATGGLYYSWFTTDTASISCLDCDMPIVKPNSATAYHVIISDQYHCADTLTTNVRIHPLPIVVVEPRDTTVKYGSIIKLTATGAHYYTWWPAGGLDDARLAGIQATITHPITLNVLGMDDYGCTNLDSVHISVDYNAPVVIPSAFSPNGDGRNDLFHVGGLTFQRIVEFRVFNRWGQEVFNTTIPSEGWDGTFHGEPQETGVYQYLIRIGYPNGRVDLYKGDVTLVR